MIPLLLIIVPLIGGLISFLLKEDKAAKSWSLLIALVTLAIALSGIYFFNNADALSIHLPWLPALGSGFDLHMDGMSSMLTLLTAIGFPIIFVAIYKNSYTKPGNFFAGMLLTQAGLMGVFVAADALVFYFFWELALIPVYFLASNWGGEKRIAATFKFFVYTFVGSLLMLIGIFYLYFQTPGNHSFAIESFYHLHLSTHQQYVFFWLFFIAFAIKMPLFPLHTWQPDAYEQATTGVTMVLSAIMVKMGLYATIRWLVPVFPEATTHFANFIIILAVIGMLYASLIAIRQDDFKRVIAYSSIAHIGLMCAAIFAQKEVGWNGVMVQMFNHGIVVLGLWIVADAIEQQLGTRKLSELGGLAQKAPELAILFVIMALANIALPLTNSFIGEFLMFNGLFQYNMVIAIFALITIILTAVYTLNTVQKIFYGDLAIQITHAVDAGLHVRFILWILVVVIFFFGIYPEPMIHLTHETVKELLVQ
ncbi:MAG: NADH-quinone oxidoreductase subunit M [Hydrotalea flava]|uniref:complex I subunit 4 family protein n=1 Tax=Hydrotalea TaxID=1004300 RepID=UPI001026034E|nr:MULTISPECIES: NADH-quinone oxidoreductase subunit M [Hydrotalea]MBY0347191.1 NADH-quinone oxidoreductase subunit M [Hydrotalea flava]RWZ89123.1 MAG: NADH-quinone oxidoreductase subunit M [Hydrotalea sp. AMD]GHV24211.1 NADH:ubiquinone oxidoreductase subunit M [Spirochaetia bacterium]